MFPLMQGNEGTFTFLETVLKEVLELFPSQHIHIGGDEVGHPAVSFTCCVSLLHHNQLCLCCCLSEKIPCAVPEHGITSERVTLTLDGLQALWRSSANIASTVHTLMCTLIEQRALWCAVPKGAVAAV